MKSKTIIVSFIAIFVLAFALSVVATDHDSTCPIFDDSGNRIDVSDDLEDIIKIELLEVNGVSFNIDPESDDIYIGQVSDIIPIFVQFEAKGCVDEIVRVTAYIDDYRVDIEDSVTLRTPLEEDVKGYTARLSLKLPSSLDLRDKLSEDTRLYLRFKAHGFNSYEVSYDIRMSKDLESLNILSIGSPQTITAGSTFAVDVVLENNGHLRLDDVYIEASIPELGVKKKIYVGDLESERDIDYDEIRDTLNKIVYLTLPRNVAPGSYELEVKAYNYETIVRESKSIVISEVSTDIIPSTGSKTISAGEEVTFDIVLLNTNNNMVIYTISPGTIEGLIVEISEPVVAVGADSSKTVKVKVKATSSVKEGTHTITINVNSESGTVNPISFTVNVDKGKTVASRVTGTTDPVVIWTIVLVIVFVVLLVILIVLLTKKPVESEEFGETSYY